MIHLILLLGLFFIFEGKGSPDEIIRDQEIRYADYLDSLNENETTFRHDFNDDVNTLNYKQNFVTIGLGCNCHAAWYTRQYNIRTYAFPFDWCLTPYQALYDFIKTDFKTYFARENLVSSSQTYFTNPLQSFFDRLLYTSISESNNWVLDKQSGMIYNHDFPDNNPSTISNYYESQYAKYKRRIERLYSELHSNKQIYFIRHYDITKSQAVELYQLLKDKFPKANFTLIVIGDNATEFSNSWGIPHIKNYYSLSYNEPFWKKLCTDIETGNLQN